MPEVRGDQRATRNQQRGPMTRRCVFLSVVAVAALACGGDRATAPSEADRAAAEFERAAADLGFASAPSAALTSAAAAIRGGARVTQVDISVGGTTERWSAFAHEIRFEVPASSAAPWLAPTPMRSILA